MKGPHMFDDVTGVTLGNALSALAARQQVTANNIANIDTPNFSAKRLSFEDSLAAAVAGGDPSSFQVTTTATDDLANANGNNVSLDDETVIAMKDTLRSQLLASALTAGFSRISTSVKG